MAYLSNPVTELRRHLWTLALLLCAAAAPLSAQAQLLWQEGVHYETVVPAVPTTTPGKIEVTEVFSYGCPFCYQAQAIVAPTRFQQSLLPETFRLRSEVIHEGVDTTTVKRHPAPRLTLASGKTIAPGTPVVTFINRRFEPLRGFHIFARALPALLEAVPDVEVVVIGADEPGGYGTPAGKGETWGRKLFAEVEGRLDRSRVHFVGRVPHATMLATLSLSSAHVYFTYPFVMSWSLLDAMAAECLVIGSDTAPVRDAITHGQNGLLVDFFDVEGLSRQLIAACREPEKYLPLRAAARATVVERFDRASVCLPAWLKLIDRVLGETA